MPPTPTPEKGGGGGGGGGIAEGGRGGGGRGGGKEGQSAISTEEEDEVMGPQILVVGDVLDPFAPAGQANLLLRGTEAARSAAKEFLNSTLPQLWLNNSASNNGCGGGEGGGINSNNNNNNNLDNCALSAIEACIDLLRPTGGKLHAFLTALPTLGRIALKVREPMGGGDREKFSTLQSQSTSLNALAAVAADSMVCIDVNVLSPAGFRYFDAASLSVLPGGTGGTMASYVPFNAAADFDQLVNDLVWNVSRMQGLEAVMRVRCSTGLDVEPSTFSGSFHRPPGCGSDLFLPAVDCDKAINVRLTIQERLPVGGEAYVQAALLYTDTSGRRLVRIHTLAFSVTDNMATVFKHADLDAQITYLARRVAAALPSSNTLASCREVVNGGVVATLAAYRKYCAAGSSAVQLILPEALKLLPLYALALLKGPGLRDGARLDERALWVSQINSLPPARLAPLLYPRLISLQPLLSSVAAAFAQRMERHGGGGGKGGGGVGGSTTTKMNMNVNVNITALTSEVMEEMCGKDSLLNSAAAYEGLTLCGEQLQTGGLFLLENGMDAYLYFTPSAPPALLQGLLGVRSYEELMRLPPTAVPSLITAEQHLQETEVDGEGAVVTATLAKLLAKIRQQRSSFMRLRVARRGDPLEITFLHLLIEDRSPAGSSYVEYLCQVHRLIQAKLS